VVCASVLGLLIPPSVTMIVYGWVTGTSILACFLATLGPGLLISAFLCVLNFFMSRKFPLKLDPAPAMSALVNEAAKRTMNTMPALLMPVIILGGIYGGVMTPTEAAALAVIYSIPVGLFFYRGLSFKKFIEGAQSSATSVGAIMIMIIFSMMLSQMFVMENIPQALVEVVFSVTQNKVVLLILINLLLFVVGMIVNDITAILLIAPLLMPLMKAIGVDPIHFAAIMGVNTALGGVTPPYASILYLGMRIGDAEFTEVLPPTMTFICLGYVPVCFLVSFWPSLALYIPRALGY
jgi:tripartite ATP-independent transporter DctM subunit